MLYIRENIGGSIGSAALYDKVFGAVAGPNGTTERLGQGVGAQVELISSGKWHVTFVDGGVVEVNHTTLTVTVKELLNYDPVLKTGTNGATATHSVATTYTTGRCVLAIWDDMLLIATSNTSGNDTAIMWVIQKPLTPESDGVTTSRLVVLNSNGLVEQAGPNYVKDSTDVVKSGVVASMSLIGGTPNTNTIRVAGVQRMVAGLYALVLSNGFISTLDGRVIRWPTTLLDSDSVSVDGLGDYKPVLKGEGTNWALAVKVQV